MSEVPQRAPDDALSLSLEGPRHVIEAIGAAHCLQYLTAPSTQRWAQCWDRESRSGKYR